MSTTPNTNAADVMRPRFGPPKRCTEIYGLNHTRIYNLAAQGRIRLVKLDGRTLVDFESVDQLMASLPPADVRQAA
jgi:hypothetical protein